MARVGAEWGRTSCRPHLRTGIIRRLQLVKKVRTILPYDFYDFIILFDEFDGIQKDDPHLLHLLRSFLPHLSLRILQDEDDVRELTQNGSAVF